MTDPYVTVMLAYLRAINQGPWCWVASVESEK